jgi:hypothetical protein
MWREELLEVVEVRTRPADVEERGRQATERRD